MIPVFVIAVVLAVDCLYTYELKTLWMLLVFLIFVLTCRAACCRYNVYNQHVVLCQCSKPKTHSQTHIRDMQFKATVYNKLDLSVFKYCTCICMILYVFSSVVLCFNALWANQCLSLQQISPSMAPSKQVTKGTSPPEEHASEISSFISWQEAIAAK